jgi:group I intron endonuclease
MEMYVIKNLIDNKEYVGITCDTHRRWLEHKRDLRKDNHDNCHLQAAYNKHGFENFEFKVVQTFESMEEMRKSEVDYINKNNLMDSNNGYNLAVGGIGFNHTDETKLKMSGRNLIAIVSKDLKTGELSFYNSMKEAYKDGLDSKGVSNACLGRNLTFKNKVWMKKSEYDIDPDELDRKFNKYQNVKARPSGYAPVVGKNVLTGEIIRLESTYHSKKMGFDYQTIHKCCLNNGINLTHKNYVWAYLVDEVTLDYKITLAKNKKTHKVL